jgi:general secretion pathway protein A
MYERFYGLSRTPFAVTPDPLMLFMSRVHREALATIIYGVETRKGFIVCTGEVGTGKSTIIRAFFDQAGADAVKLIYTFTPQVTPLEMATFICQELELEEPESVFAAVPRLQLKLLEVFESGRTVVLMIDEAQLLPPETLEFLRLLSNFETDTEKLIQIVLVGQPEVDTMLARRDMRQVSQRVALRARLGAFSLEESFEYIEHRLRVSGAGDLAQVMSPSAAWLIADAAGGIPRRINILADNALIAGFGAAQRPLGSHRAGIAINEFIAKSGAANPVAAQPFGSSWRAARRLRSALARERGEPAEFVSATPPPAPRPTRPTDQSSSVLVQPRATPQVERAAPVEPAAREYVAQPAAPAVPEPAAAWQVSRLAAGEAISAGDIAIIAPIAPPIVQPIVSGEDAKMWVGYEPAAAPPDLLVPPWPSRAPAEEPRFALGVNGATASHDVVVPAPAVDLRPGTSVQWPALSRVRSGLQTASPRAQDRGFSDSRSNSEG